MAEVTKQDSLNMTPKRARFSPNISPSYAFTFIFIPLFSIVAALLKSTPNSNGILAAICISALGYWLLVMMIPNFCTILQVNASKAGSDLCKTPKKPDDASSPAEPIGIFVSIFYLTITVYLQIFLSHDTIKMMEYNAGLFTICFVSLLGYADDCLKLAWRYKILTPLIGSVPIILTYQGSTTIILPKFCYEIFGVSSFNMHFFYHLLMLGSIVFYCNAINILAGINGLEVGQSLILSFFMILYNTIEIISLRNTMEQFPSFQQDTILYQNILSLYFSIPFFSCSLSTFLFNWTPTKFFVGDSYTYFAGAHFAVTAITGHSIRTFVLFSLPQIVNFVMSLPQLLPFFFGPFGNNCPNHRLPHLDRKSDPLLQASKVYSRIFNVDQQLSQILIKQIDNASFEDEEHHTEWTILKEQLERIEKKTQIYPIYFKPHTEKYYSQATKSYQNIPILLSPKEINNSKTNFTLICFFLKVFGPMKEQTLVGLLLATQFLSGCLGLLIRYSPLYSIFIAYKN